MTKRTYGWKPDKKDERDLNFLYKDIKPTITLPKVVNMISKCSPIVDQGELGSCTANAGAGCFEFLELKYGITFLPVSRLFVYYNERLIEGTVSEDSGASIRDIIKAAASWGWCSEKEWPYNINEFTVKPGKQCYKDAVIHEIKSYHRVLNQNDMLTCLADGFPFIFGITVFESFESDSVAKTGIVPVPNPATERQLGGHAMLAVGYDENTQRFDVRNSWGAGWGAKGYCTIPFAYINKWASDYWTVRK
jgi:C1A family cysteine protease